MLPDSLLSPVDSGTFLMATAGGSEHRDGDAGCALQFEGDAHPGSEADGQTQRAEGIEGDGEMYGE